VYALRSIPWLDVFGVGGSITARGNETRTGDVPILFRSARGAPHDAPSTLQPVCPVPPRGHGNQSCRRSTAHCIRFQCSTQARDYLQWKVRLISKLRNDPGEVLTARVPIERRGPWRYRTAQLPMLAVDPISLADREDEARWRNSCESSVLVELLVGTQQDDRPGSTARCARAY